MNEAGMRFYKSSSDLLSEHIDDTAICSQKELASFLMLPKGPTMWKIAIFEFSVMVPLFSIKEITNYRDPFFFLMKSIEFYNNINNTWLN